MMVNVKVVESEGETAIRVLSLFDGISTGKVVLDSLGIQVDSYFASEIDETAIAVSKVNHGDSITHIGPIENIDSETINDYLPIHLVIGGSPCNDLSLVNGKRKGLTDLSGSGRLFFEFFRVIKLLEKKENLFYYLFENVPMEHKNRIMISRFFEMDPVEVDSQYVSPMLRKRLFWGNIPELEKLCNKLKRVAEDSYTLQSCLTPNLRRKALVSKIRTVTTNKNSLTLSDGTCQVEMNGVQSELSTVELERVFGFEPHYTDVLNCTHNMRKALLGRSWSVPSLKLILRPLAKVFKRKDDQ